ncbi:MAG: hypothetical protein FWF81_13570 [Defluviitaleaceae bacterium]|nr:hypothetical protein [Defluviitaleaceae bacterium]
MSVIIILTEGGSEYGYGHISRCCALYTEAINQGISCVIYVAGDADISEEYCWNRLEWRTLSELKTISFEKEDVVIDSYHATIEICEFIVKKSENTLFIDDDMRINYPSPCTVLNPSLYAEKKLYPKKKDVKYLLGIQYALVRPAFCSKIQQRDRRGVMITMGGSDVADITYSLYKELKWCLPKLPVKIILGHGFKNKDRFLRLKYNYSEIIENASAEEMRETMLSCEAAFSAGGQTLYELLTTQTPMIVFKVADNQSDGMNALLDLGIIKKIYHPKDVKAAAHDFIKGNTLTPPLLVDGKGAKNVLRSWLS